MTLYELAFSCFIFKHLEGVTLKEFLKEVNNAPDLKNSNHRKALIRWLNEMGCRNFAIKYHAHASEELLSWYSEFNRRLCDANKKLWEFSDGEIDSISELFDKLSKKIASYRKNKIEVRFGPTAASKILFAIRPQAFMMWDKAIRKELNFDGSGASYVNYLRDAKNIIKDLENQCIKKGFELLQLPKKIGREYSSVVKLIDEYHWIAITKKKEIQIHPPSKTNLKQWLNWS